MSGRRTTQRQAERDVDEIREDTYRTLQKAVGHTNEAYDIGAATLEELHRQGEQIERVQRKVDEIEVHANKGNALLDDINRGFFKRLFGVGKPKTKEKTAEQQLMEKQIARARRDEKVDARIERDLATSIAQERARGDVRDLAKDKRFVEEDELLDQLSGNLSGIKHMAVEMNAELDRQDPMLDELVHSVHKNQLKLASNTAKAKRIVGK